jgi:anti-sigma B factor antagonist
MDITRHTRDGRLLLAVSGRIDGYWADHLNTVVSDAVRQGYRRIRVDCANVTFLSSAGIGVLVQCHKQLTGISGAFHVTNPSKPVLTLLDMTRLTDILVDRTASEESPAETGVHRRSIVRDGLHARVHDFEDAAPLVCRAIGDAPGAEGRTATTACSNLGEIAPAVAIGVGAFGAGFDDCRSRFGEWLAVGGAAVYQPGDGTNVADYLVAHGPLGGDVQLLHGLVCEGGFRQLITFETMSIETPIGLSTLIRLALDESGATAAAIVMVAEASGLVGAAIRRSPVATTVDRHYLAFPQVRANLSFTAEPAYVQSVALIGGVVSREGGADHPQLRPVGGGAMGHLHAAAFRFHAVKKGYLDLAPTVASLFDDQRLLGVLHLLHDDRGAAGAGESTFIRGACWVGPLTGGFAVEASHEGTKARS